MNVINGAGVVRISGQNVVLAGLHPGFTGVWLIKGTARPGPDIQGLGPNSRIWLDGPQSVLEIDRDTAVWSRPVYGTGRLQLSRSQPGRRCSW